MQRKTLHFRLRQKISFSHIFRTGRRRKKYIIEEKIYNRSDQEEFTKKKKQIKCLRTDVVTRDEEKDQFISRVFLDWETIKIFRFFKNVTFSAVFFQHLQQYFSIN